MSLSIDILLVEDDDADAVLLSRHLEPHLREPLTRAANLTDATELAGRREFDVAVLDLGLPDAWGLDALLRFSRHVPDLPVIVVTGTQTPGFAEKARRAGAVGFVSKTLPESEIAMEIITMAAAVLGGPSAGESELRQLDQVGTPRRLPATSHLYGRTDLIDSDPDLWEHCVGRYGDLLDLVLEQATFGTDLRTGEHLQALASDLAGLRAGPRDLISIHTAAVRRQLEAANGVGVDDILTESRLTVLETMGHLAAYYRTASLGADASSSDVGR